FDVFGDTIEIMAAFDTVHAGPTGTTNVRIPASGNLQITLVLGNTTCVVGGSLPCRVGPPGSTLSGLPGLPTAGIVGYAPAPADQYLTQPNDNDPLTDTATATVRDLGDAPGTINPPIGNFNEEFGGTTDLIHPDIDLSKSASPSEFCSGQAPQLVTYHYTVTN